MPVTTDPDPEDQNKETLKPDSTNHQQEGDSSGFDSDFSDDNQKAVEKATREKAAAEKAAAEKAAAEKAAAERAAAEKAAAEKATGGKSVVEEQEDNFIPTSEEIGKRLKDLIKKDRKLLQKKYGREAELDEKLEEQIEKGEKMARRLITEMECKPEVAKDLTVLTLYDVAILIGMCW